MSRYFRARKTSRESRVDDLYSTRAAIVRLLLGDRGLMGRLFQCMGVGQQLWEIMGVEDDKRSYRRYHRAATDPCVIGERSENRSLGEKLGILG